MISEAMKTTIKTLFEKGYNKSQISRMLQIDRKTVRAKLKESDEELIIEHTQEAPEYKKVYLFNNLGSLIEEDLKIFIIDENEYNIMLLAEEY